MLKFCKKKKDIVSHANCPSEMIYESWCISNKKKVSNVTERKVIYFAVVKFFWKTRRNHLSNFTRLFQCTAVLFPTPDVFTVILVLKTFFQLFDYKICKIFIQT